MKWPSKSSSRKGLKNQKFHNLQNKALKAMWAKCAKKKKRLATHLMSTWCARERFPEKVMLIPGREGQGSKVSELWRVFLVEGKACDGLAEGEQDAVTQWAMCEAENRSLVRGEMAFRCHGHCGAYSSSTENSKGNVFSPVLIVLPL